MDDQGIPPDIDADALNGLFAEHMRWAFLQFSLRDLAEALPDLVDEISRFEPTRTVALLAGLLTEPDYQSTTLRVELLIGLALTYACGTEQPDWDDAVRWFSVIGDSPASSGEDPSEDVFVTLVANNCEDFLVLEGLWESAGFYTQCVLELVQQMPGTALYEELRTEVRALLVVSDIVCKRAGLTRYQTGSDLARAELDPRTLPPLHQLQQRVSITFDDLASRGVSIEHLQAFVFSMMQRETLADQELGLSDLDRRPLMQSKEGIIVVLPTAVSTAMRDHVIEFIVGSRQTGNFDSNYSRLLGIRIEETRLFGSESGCKLRWQLAGPDRISSAIFPFDHGYHIVLHFLLPSISVHVDGRFKHPIQASEVLVQALDYAIGSTTEQVEGTDDFRAGLHIIVLCGWGKGMGFSMPRNERPCWQYESIALPDLIRLSNIDSMSVARFWRLQDAVTGLRDAGVELSNINGVLNLIGWVEYNNGHLVPHADIGDGRYSPDRPLVIHPPLNLLRDVRAKVDQTTDVHIGTDVHGKAHRLQRVETLALFPNASDRRVYACVDCVTKGKLIATVEGSPTVWVRIEAPNLTSRDQIFQLWTMLGSWCGRIVNALEMSRPWAESVELTFRFEDTQEEVDDIKSVPPANPNALILYERTARSSATLHIGTGFMHAFRIPSNVAEHALVKAALRSILTIRGVSNPNDVIAELVPAIVPNDTGRHFHVMHAHEFTDFIRFSLPSEALSIDDIDSARLRLGLGWSVHDGANDIEGVGACCSLLNRLVDKRVESVLAKLRELDRASLIRRLLVNHEAGNATEIHWKRTSAAVLGLHGDSEATRASVVEHLSRAAGAQVTSRVLIEMALCSAPAQQGRSPANIEIEFLLAEVALIIHLGGLSDGIHYGALEPHLRVSPLGDILLEDSFGREVVEPILSAAIGNGYVRSAQNLRRYYSKPQAIESTNHLFESAFIDAWDAEMGFTIDDGRRMLDALENKAIYQRKPVMTLRRSQLVALLASSSNVGTSESFVDRFTLMPRDNWNLPPDGFKKQEVYPWRFGRRLSVVTRPLLQIDSTDDPLYMVSPTLVRSGFHYLLRGAHAGTLNQEFFNSKAMRDTWWGKAHEGHTFNAEVAQRLREAGWNANENIELPAILQRKLDRDYGDVDVLAWRDGDERVLVIECKDLTLRRNYSEIAALLSDYRGELKGGKPDKLLLHLNRVEYLQQDSLALGRHTGIASPKIQSCLVVSGLVPMQLVTVPALQETFVGDVNALLAKIDE